MSKSIRELFLSHNVPTTTPVVLPGGVSFTLEGRAAGFNADQVAVLAEAQTEAIKSTLKATAEDSDIVKAGGKVRSVNVYNPEKVGLLAQMIRAAASAPAPVPTVNRDRKPRGLPKDKTETVATVESNGAAS